MTILIWTKVDRKKYVSISKKLMDNVYSLGAEQVGFVEKTKKNNKAIAHLQMMGGEFCGNTARSFAFMLVQKKITGIVIKNNISKFLISISGVKEPLEATVFCDKDNNPIYPKVEMPIYKNINSVCVKNNSDLVSMEGISHIILDKPNNEFNIKKYKDELIELKDKLNLKEESAVGAIWTEKIDNNTFSIKPVVWVNKTNSYYYETSCGSGTIALALKLAKEKKEKLQEYKIFQPSGDFIKASILRNDKKFEKAWIEGNINIIAEGFCYI